MKKDVVELFAGVGGFRVGLNEVKMSNKGVVLEKPNFNFVWVNQWEPSTKIQHAFDCYQNRFGYNPNHSNIDIGLIDKTTIPDHTLLVGGFPCQDYSVARSLSNERGIEGKKGVLWWQINEILLIKRPPFVLLENVDRLIKSPSKQRGRDFGIMLRCFNDLGYAVEWRVINAADYGYPQRRRRVYIFAYHKSSSYYKKMQTVSSINLLEKEGLFAKNFPVQSLPTLKICDINQKQYVDLIAMTKKFQFLFQNAGCLINGIISTVKSVPVMEEQLALKTILQTKDIPDECFIDSKLDKFRYLKGSKKIERVKNGVTYFYSEGSIPFPDNLDAPARTMLTSEGSVNRSTHVVLDSKTKRYRLLTPVETERLNQFPDNWTEGMPLRRRYFMMGNALVCGVITRLSDTLLSIME